MPPFASQFNLLRERYEFYNRRQKWNETLDDFAEEIRHLAASCRFGSEGDGLVRDHVLFGLRDKKICKAIVEEGGNPSTQEVIALCEALMADQKSSRTSRRSQRQQRKIENITEEIDEDIKIKIEPAIEITTTNAENTSISDEDDIRDAFVEPIVETSEPHEEEWIEDESDSDMNAETPEPQSTSEKATDEPSLLCTICGQLFRYLTTLKFHQLQHDGPQYACEICPKKFLLPRLLKDHQKVHGERKHICDRCNKSFMDRYKLQRHIRTHTGERPFVCSVCSKGFVQAWSLEVHMRLHTGEKPYTCKECGREFSDGRNWKKHEKIHEKYREAK